MRILQISSARNYGGGERHLVDLCRGLDEMGHEVFVALRETNHFVERLDFLGKENIVYAPLWNSIDIFSAFRLARFIKDRKIDIVHAHLARDYPIASLAVRFSSKTKLVITRHVLFEMSPLHRYFLKNVSRAIAVSSGVQRHLRNIFPADKIALISNGLEIQNWIEADREKVGAQFRVANRIPKDVPLVGILGELLEIKGQEDFVAAAQEISKEIPAARFLIAGKDNSPDGRFRAKIDAMIDQRQLQDRFTFLEWVDDTAPLLSALDVFVSASHTESFGLAILEAMASGTAVVATETDGAKELIRDGETGLLTAVKTPIKLAEGICGILENNRKRNELGKNAAVFARETFSLEKMINRTEEVYKKATSS